MGSGRTIVISQIPSYIPCHFRSILLLHTSPLPVLYSTNLSTSFTFVQVLQKMRRFLRTGAYTQIPQLTSSHPIDMDQEFYLVPPTTKNTTGGTHRAVLIGINYKGQSGELTGCHNDCLNMKDYLVEECGLSTSNITVLMDDGYHTSPTRSNILDAVPSSVKVKVAMPSFVIFPVRTFL